MYQSLQRAVLAALALSAAAWALLIFMGQELVEVPMARAAPSPALVHTVADTHAGLRQGRHETSCHTEFGSRCAPRSPRSR
jgi:hypothetical protein